MATHPVVRITSASRSDPPDHAGSVDTAWQLAGSVLSLCDTDSGAPLVVSNRGAASLGRPWKCCAASVPDRRCLQLHRAYPSLPSDVASGLTHGVQPYKSDGACGRCGLVLPYVGGNRQKYTGGGQENK